MPYSMSGEGLSAKVLTGLKAGNSQNSHAYQPSCGFRCGGVLQNKKVVLSGLVNKAIVASQGS